MSVAAAACAPTTFLCTTTHDEKLLSLGVRESVIQFRRVKSKMSSQVRSRGPPPVYPPAGPALVPHALTTPLGWGTSVAFSQLTAFVLIAGPHCPWV